MSDFNKVDEKVGLTFDDVLIKPLFSDIDSRKLVDTSSYEFPWGVMSIPVFSANMASVTGNEMAMTMHHCGGMGVLHRFGDDTLPSNDINYSVSVGVGSAELARAKFLLKNGAKYFFLDVAHGAQQQVIDQYNALKDLGCTFVAIGNFASIESIETYLGATEATPDAFKVGVGPGSVCTTRIKTGCGIPQLTAILDICNFLRQYNIKSPVIADGGMKTPGDIAKAIAAGADAVMIGGMLAGTSATPGEVFEINGKKYKKYEGSAYKSGNDVTGYNTSEGVSKSIPYKGETTDVLADIEGGLRSAMAYVGAWTLNDFRDKARFIRVSANSVKENGAHYKEQIK